MSLGVGPLSTSIYSNCNSPGTRQERALRRLAPPPSAPSWVPGGDAGRGPRRRPCGGCVRAVRRPGRRCGAGRRAAHRQGAAQRSAQPEAAGRHRGGRCTGGRAGEERGLQATLGVERGGRELELAQAEIEGLRVCLGESQAAWAAHVAAQELRGREAGPRRRKGCRALPVPQSWRGFRLSWHRPALSPGQTRAELTGAQADLAHAHAELQGGGRSSWLQSSPWTWELEGSAAPQCPARCRAARGLGPTACGRTAPTRHRLGRPAATWRSWGPAEWGGQPGRQPRGRTRAKIGLRAGKGELRGDDRHEPYLEELALRLPCNGACAARSCIR